MRSPRSPFRILALLAVALTLLAPLAGCKKEESLEGEVKAGARTRDNATAIQQQSTQRAADADAVGN